MRYKFSSILIWSSESEKKAFFMFELDKWNAEPGQSSRQGSLGHQASGKGCSTCLWQKKTEISCALLPPAFHPAFAATEEGMGACRSTSLTPKGHLLPALRSRNSHSHPLGQFQPHLAPFFLHERQQITLNCDDIDWQNKYLTADIFKLRCLHVHQIRVCEIFHHPSQIFLISYLWILDSQILFWSWRLFI